MSKRRHGFSEKVQDQTGCPKKGEDQRRLGIEIGPMSEVLFSLAEGLNEMGKKCN